MRITKSVFWIENEGFDTVSRHYIMQNIFKELYVQLTPDELLQLAHQPSVFINDCEVNGGMPTADCNIIKSDGGVPLFNHEFGVCFTFNFRATNLSNPTVNSLYPGFLYGIRMTFKLEGEALFPWAEILASPGTFMHLLSIYSPIKRWNELSRYICLLLSASSVAKSLNRSISNTATHTSPQDKRNKVILSI